MIYATRETIAPIYTRSEEKLTSARSAHESQVVESGNLVLEARCSIAEVSCAVFVIPGRQYDLSAIWEVAERDNLERDRERLIATPVRGKDGADEVRAVRADQLSRVLGQHLGERSLPAEPFDRRVFGG